MRLQAQWQDAQIFSRVYADDRKNGRINLYGILEIHSLRISS